MRPRTVLVLFLVVAALAAFIWFVERDLPSSEERAELAQRVLRLEPGDVLAVTVERGEERVRIERQPPEAPAEGEAEAASGLEGTLAEGRWRIVEPLAARADGGEVDSLVGAVAELETVRRLEGADRAAAGLDEPRARIVVETATAEHELLLGAAVPASNNMVVAAGDGALHVVDEALWRDVDRSPGDWRSRDLFDVERDRIGGIRLVRGENSVELERRGEGFWLASPVADRADGELVSDLLGDLVALTADGFVDEPQLGAAEMGLEPPEAVVEIVPTGGGESARLELGGPVEASEDLRYGRIEDQFVTLERGLDEALERPAGEWQDDSWSSLESWEIDRLELSGAEGEMVLERAGGDWKRGDETIAYGPVSDLLYALTGAMGDELLPPALAGELGEPRLEVRLVSSEGEETLRLYAASGGSSPAAAAGRDWLVMLSTATVDDLLLKLEEVRTTEPEGVEVPAPEEG